MMGTKKTAVLIEHDEGYQGGLDPNEDLVWHINVKFRGSDMRAVSVLNGDAEKQLADLQAKHTRLHDKAEAAYNAYDGNGEEAFDELMEDLGREIHGSE